MTKSKTIVETLDTLTNLIIDNYKNHVGDAPNDWGVTDIARSIAKMPFWSAKNKRDYIDRLRADIAGNTQYVDGEALPEPDQGQAYHDAKRKYERIAPNVEIEAMAFDALGEIYAQWFKDYTGQEFSLYGNNTKNVVQLSKKQQAAMRAIEARHKVA